MPIIKFNEFCLKIDFGKKETNDEIKACIQNKAVLSSETLEQVFLKLQKTEVGLYFTKIYSTAILHQRILASRISYCKNRARNAFKAKA